VDNNFQRHTKSDDNPSCWATGLGGTVAWSFQKLGLPEQVEIRNQGQHWQEVYVPFARQDPKLSLTIWKKYGSNNMPFLPMFTYRQVVIEQLSVSLMRTYRCVFSCVLRSPLVGDLLRFLAGVHIRHDLDCSPSARLDWSEKVCSRIEERCTTICMPYWRGSAKCFCNGSWLHNICHSAWTSWSSSKQRRVEVASKIDNSLWKFSTGQAKSCCTILSFSTFTENESSE
jgi:hypothetical protein